MISNAGTLVVASLIVMKDMKLDSPTISGDESAKLYDKVAYSRCPEI